MDAWLERYKSHIFVALIALIVVGGGVLASRRPQYKPLEIQMPTPSPTVEPLIKVHIAGAVLNPGVYTLKDGDRVADAIAAAGGFTEDANRDALNLAARLADGQKIAVPRLGEPTPVSASNGEATGKVNINTATQAQLEALPGIGPVTAQRIIDFRTRNGPFKRLEDLKDQKLVPASTFEKIKDKITL